MSELALTPMMRQYHTIKKEYPGMLLFFRMGDFYEMFEDDAVEASRILNLTLTKRNGIPMCGVPHHAADNYLERLLQAGQRIAVCDQMENPAAAKGIVKRAVTRVLTPGTLVEDNLLGGQEHNYLMCFYAAADQAAAALCDISTGDFIVIASEAQAPELFFRDECSRFSPSEVVVAESMRTQIRGWMESSVVVSTLRDWDFEEGAASERLKRHFSLASLDSFMLSAQDCSLQAAAGVLAYLEQTQKTVLANVRTLHKENRSSYMVLPGATRQNLELVRNLGGGSDHTLFSVLNVMVTPMGVRFLKHALLNPLLDTVEINRRLDGITVCVQDQVFLKNLRDALKPVKDLERLSSRIALRRANARDLVGLRYSLEQVQAIRLLLLEKPFLLPYREHIADFYGVIAFIAGAILDEPAALLREGNMIRDGYNAELDELRALSASSHDWIARLQAAERERTGIASLKIKYNRVVGYFIEVSNANTALVPDEYERKQTLVNGERYSIPELKEYEHKILTAKEKICALEEELFSSVIDTLQQYLDSIHTAARGIAELDFFAAMAALALQHNYVRPMVDEETRLCIEDGRHPVIECSMDEAFVPNTSDLDLDEKRIQIITGPNMAGKSTYLRQTALIVLMAQAGMYVPAASAAIGVVDRIFTRIGASDNLARGQSTFLVEMLETAAVLNNASSRSLIIMDEIGRGTSTYDGLALAWAIIEFLHLNRERGGRTLFATHYHELTILAEESGIVNLNVAVKEWNDQVIFLRKVVSGAADQSYGIHVARLAGLPAAVISRATEILCQLEEQSGDLKESHRLFLNRSSVHAMRVKENQLPLFRPYEEEVLEQIRQLDVNTISPLDALSLLVAFKEKL